MLFSIQAIAKPTPSPKPTSTPKPTPRIAAPKNVIVKALSATSSKVTWKKVEGAQEYRIYRSYSIKGPFHLLSTVKTLEFIDTGLKPGFSYYYRVESYAKNNTSIQTSPRPVKMPTPSPTPFVEPKYSLVDGDYADWGKSYGYPWFKYQVKNISKSYTIDGFTLVFYATDVYGNKIKAHGFGDYYQYEIYNQTVKSGKSLYSEKRTVYGFDAMKNLHVAIQKYHLTNGRTITIPDEELVFWRLEY